MTQMAGVEFDGARLRAFNEAQNRIQAQLLRLLTASTQRYPDDVFANILVDQFQALRVDPEDLRGLSERVTEPPTAPCPY